MTPTRNGEESVHELRKRGMRRLALRVASVGALGLACVLPLGCDDGSGPADVIDRETFIGTYVDLRREALTSTDARLDDAAREEVLRRHDVTEQDLLDFADAHGRDVDFLRQLWTDIEARMDSVSTDDAEGPRTDTNDGGPGPGGTRPSDRGGAQGA